MDSRLIHFIKKEFIQLFRDRRLLVVAFVAPVIQLFILGYIASTDIKNVSTAVLDQDKTVLSRNYLDNFKNSGYFNFNYYLNSDKDMAPLLDSGKAKLVLNVPSGFAKKIMRREPARVQAILDGTDSSAAVIIQGYINQITFIKGREFLENRIARMRMPLQTEPRIFYNPELKSVNFMVPAIFALLLMIESTILTSAAIVKEKERGTMELLVTTPLKPHELILGKLLPYAIVAFLDIIIVFLVATLWFKVPFRGSLILLFSLGALFLTAGLGLGVFISTISRTQRQTMLSVVFIMIPSIILSGFIFPIANMPQAIQALTYLIPIRYFLVIVRGIFLKGIGINYLWPEVWPLILFGAVILTLSILRFKKKID